jgi:vacuolar protein sorting-associated protein 13A/C
MNLIQLGMESIKFVSSAEADSPDRDLLSLHYRRVQKDSPEFLTVHEGIDQSVDIRISTFVFRAAPEPVVNLYDFIMTTFVPPATEQTIPQIDHRSSDTAAEDSSTRSSVTDKIRVQVKLASVKGCITTFIRAL